MAKQININLAGGYATRVCFLEFGDIFKFLITDSEYIVVRIASNRVYYRSVIQLRYGTQYNGYIRTVGTNSNQWVYYFGKRPLKRKQHVQPVSKSTQQSEDGLNR